jgi:hypothetical protein
MDQLHRGGGSGAVRSPYAWEEQVACGGTSTDIRRQTSAVREPLSLEEAMRKLRLDLDALAVESFAAQAEHAAAEGTVQGHLNTGVYSCAATCRCPSHHNTECCGII